MQVSLNLTYELIIDYGPASILLYWTSKNWFIEKLNFKRYETDEEFSTLQPKLSCNALYYGDLWKDPEHTAWQVIQAEMCYLKHSGYGIPLGAQPLLRAKALLTKNRAKIVFEEPGFAFAKGNIFADLTWYYSKLKHFIKKLSPRYIDWEIKPSNDSINTERLEL